MPRLCASSSALAMGVLVKLYACTRTVLLAALSSLTTASVQPPFGEKYTSTGGRAAGTCVFQKPSGRGSRTGRLGQMPLQMWRDRPDTDDPRRKTNIPRRADKVDPLQRPSQ